MITEEKFVKFIWWKGLMRMREGLNRYSDDQYFEVLSLPKYRIPGEPCDNRRPKPLQFCECGHVIAGGQW